ncbi:P-loop containing nucleoside triphosphate hydrolase [Pseudocohnilembus persalinus]|uniref:p-loop containing nucleoside triphosphate hydrolase n=1 Tax=Pseudocohnilembus persalinus TaxID=266149 RepID=A0A0V0QPD9_PSEPJ|nr:P-loop containing nucleoside triphosphate hydrolase [Pseudocohnilembus persalinus]|eukprot:KRX03861.1 P-loop containing nucleoside triphosphate hydrolase [Pseudocohnilembus persalinus]
MESEAVNYQVLLLGQAKTGKSQILKRFGNEDFQSRYEADQNPKHRYYKFKRGIFDINMKIWESNSVKKLKRLGTANFNPLKIDCVILIYDVSNIKSFEILDKMMGEYIQFYQYIKMEQKNENLEQNQVYSNLGVEEDTVGESGVISQGISKKQDTQNNQNLIIDEKLNQKLINNTQQFSEREKKQLIRKQEQQKNKKKQRQKIIHSDEVSSMSINSSSSSSYYDLNHMNHYDVYYREEYDNLFMAQQQQLQEGAGFIQINIIGNKFDLVKQREVQENKVQNWMKKYNIAKHTKLSAMKNIKYVSLF